VAITEVAGLRVRFEMTGSGSEHVIFVHGLRNSADTWWPVKDHIDPDRYTVTYLDLPGCGESDTPSDREQCTIDAYAEFVKTFCEVIGIAHPAFVGHSLGGGIGLALELAVPGFSRCLVLVAPVSTQGLDFVSDEQFEALLNPSDTDVVEFARAAFHRPVPEDAFERLVATVRAARPAHIEGALRSFREFKVLPRLREISTPTLVVGGDRDRHVPIGFTLQTAAAIRRCAVQIYHGVGHVPFWEVPDEFATLLERYLRFDLPALEETQRARQA
jgi:sigma-B regulation protein RsbQ